MLLKNWQSNIESRIMRSLVISCLLVWSVSAEKVCMPDSPRLDCGESQHLLFSPMHVPDRVLAIFYFYVAIAITH